jgi:histidinol phosphatase-like PHP family hydrolase
MPVQEHIKQEEYYLSSIKSDFHIHTCASDGAADCTPGNIAKEAEGLGFKEIGFTDHAHFCSGNATGSRWESGIFFDPYLKVCEEIRAIKTHFNLNIYLSWEVDYFDGGTYSFDPEKHLSGLDYVLLGHHSYTHMNNSSSRELADYLFRIYMAMAIEPYANIIAHPFYYCASEKHKAVLAHISNKQFADFFHALKENGKAAEITPFQFSLRWRDNIEQYKRMYAIAKETGVKFTLDSDAHSISEVGSGLKCIHILHELGFKDDDFVDFSKLMNLKNN